MNCEIQYARHACEYSEFFIRFASTMFIDGDKNELASFDKYLNMPAKNKLFANRSTLDSVCHPKVHAFELTYIHTAIYRAHIFSLLVSHRNHKKYNWIVLIKKMIIDQTIVTPVGDAYWILIFSTKLLLCDWVRRSRSSPHLQLTSFSCASVASTRPHTDPFYLHTIYLSRSTSLWIFFRFAFIL